MTNIENRNHILEKNIIFALIVEDNPGDLELLKALIEEDSIRQVRVDAVKTLTAALEAMNDNSYDLVLLDLGLPDSFGVQTFVRLHDAFPKHTVIIMTGNDNLEIATQCIDLGAQDFLVKGRMQGFITHAMHNAIVRNTMQEALNKSYEDLRTTLNDYHYPILIIGSDNRVMLKNNQAKTLFGNETIEDTLLEEILDIQPRFTYVNQGGSERIFEKHFSLVNWFGTNSRMLTFIDITENVRAEKSILDISRFPDENPNPVLRFDMEGNLMYSNSSAKDLLDIWGVTPENGIIPANYISKIAEGLLENDIFSTEDQVGTKIYQLIYTAIKDKEYINLYAMDITERKLAEREAKLDEARLECLVRINQYPVETSQELLMYTLEEAVSLTESEFGYIYLYDENSQECQIMHWSKEYDWKASKGDPPTKYKLEEMGIWGEAVRKREPVMINNSESSFPLDHGIPADNQHIKKFLAAPFCVENRIVAVIGVANKADDYSESDIRQLLLIMGSIWKIFLRNEATTELRSREYLLEKTFNLLPIGLWFADKEGRILRGNPAGEKIWGGMPEMPIVDYGIFKARWLPSRKVLTHNDWSLAKTMHQEITIMDEMLEIDTFDGKKKIILNYSAPVVDDDGQMLGAIVMNNDITELKQAETELALSYKRLHSSYVKALQGMSAALEIRDPYTSGHQRRVAELAVAISKQLGMEETEQELVFLASIVHDLGKLYVPAEILMRPTKLTDLEYNMIRTHAEAGYQILKDIDFPWPIANIVRQHHERMDGSGYPNALQGEEIMYEARIIAVSDVVEAMASHRPYRAALGIEKARDEIRQHAGLLYDAGIVEACLTVLSGPFAFT